MQNPCTDQEQIERWLIGPSPSMLTGEHSADGPLPTIGACVLLNISGNLDLIVSGLAPFNILYSKKYKK